MATGTVDKQHGTRGEGLTIDRVKLLFSSETFRPDSDLSLIKAYYHPEVRFRDAIQELHGREAFLAMTRRFLDRAKELEVEAHEAAQTGNVIFLSWTMRLRMGKGPRTTLEGTSKLTLDQHGKVIDHRDYFDLWGDAIGSLPVVGRAYRALIQKMG
jgi:limonene-1,2-epoxide hydrolase